MSKATQVVTIKGFTPIFREGVEAQNIHIVNVEEHGFEVVSAKSLYSIGDKALFIKPDFCLSNISLFSDFIAPMGDVKKTKLGKNNRIRAVKFNFFKKDYNKVFSNGVMLPLHEVLSYLIDNNIIVKEDLTDIYSIDFDSVLGITKYEEEEKTKNANKASGGNPFPSNVYMTDEDNILTTIGRLNTILPINMIATLKVDGSSLSDIYKNENEFHICSRKLSKPIYEKKYKDWNPFFNKEKENFGFGFTNIEKGIFVLESDFPAYALENNLEYEEVLSSDDFVQLGFPILEKLKELNRPLAVRSEIFGKGLKGSGNKNNPHSNKEKDFAIYGVDDLSSGFAVPLSMKETLEVVEQLGFKDKFVPIIYKGVIESFEQLSQISEEYFKNNLVEGLVWRTFDNNAFSAKYMSQEYDSQK
jgi:hypothetical protein